MVPFDRAYANSYSRSIVTIGLSSTVSEINGDVRRKSPIFLPPVFNAPDEGVTLGIWYLRKGSYMLK